MNGEQAYTQARAEEAAAIVAEAEWTERETLYRAAQLLVPTLSFIASDSEWDGYRASVNVKGNQRTALRLSPVPAQGAPQVLTWRWYDGLRTTTEPVARLVRQDAAGAVYGIADTRAGRDLRNLLDVVETATVEVPRMSDGRPSRTGEVITG